MSDPRSKSAWLTVLESELSSIVLLTILAASLSLNVALGWKVKARAQSAAAARPRMAGIQPNSTLPASIAAVDANGRTTTLALRDTRPTILYVLSPACGWCKRNEASIRALASTQGSTFRFVGLSTTNENLREYLDQATLGFPVVGLEKPESVKELDLGVTPQTVLVRPDGTVEKVWVGAFLEQQKKDIEGFFKVTLPAVPLPERQQARAEAGGA